MSVHFNFFSISISSSLSNFHVYIDQEKDLIRVDDMYPSLSFGGRGTFTTSSIFSKLANGVYFKSIRSEWRQPTQQFSFVVEKLISISKCQKNPNIVHNGNFLVLSLFFIGIFPRDCSASNLVFFLFSCIYIYIYIQTYGHVHILLSVASFILFFFYSIRSYIYIFSSVT